MRVGEPCTMESHGGSQVTSLSSPLLDVSTDRREEEEGGGEGLLTHFIMLPLSIIMKGWEPSPLSDPFFFLFFFFQS